MFREAFKVFFAAEARKKRSDLGVQFRQTDDLPHAPAGQAEPRADFVAGANEPLFQGLFPILAEDNNVPIIRTGSHQKRIYRYIAP